MKRFIVVVSMLIGLSGAATAETLTISVNGLVCSFCAAGIEKIFRSQSAVEDVTVDLESKRVSVRTKSPQTLDDATITDLMTNAGYTVTHIARQK